MENRLCNKRKKKNQLQLYPAKTWLSGNRLIDFKTTRIFNNIQLITYLVCSNLNCKLCFRDGNCSFWVLGTYKSSKNSRPKPAELVPSHSPDTKKKKSLENFFESNFILVDFVPDQVSSFFLQLVRGSYKYLIMCSRQADENASKFSHLTWFKFTRLQIY